MIRAALARTARRLNQATARLEVDDRARQRDLDRWFAGFAAEVRGHLELVETLVLPRLAARGALDDRTLSTFAADHAWTDHLLGELGDAFGHLAHDLGDPRAWAVRAAAAAAQLDLALYGHLAIEGRLLDPLVARHFDARERAELERAILRDLAGHRAAFALPWLIDQLATGDRTIVLAFVPGPGRLVWRSRRRAYRRTAESALAGTPAA